MNRYVLTANEVAERLGNVGGAAEVAQWVCAGEPQIIDFMLSLLPQAAALATVPVSDFRVGAVVADAAGNVYFGANQEFAASALAFTVHAEQSAVANAFANGAMRLSQLAVDTPPCGHCRQFLMELDGAAALRIHLPSQRMLALPDLLRQPFGPADLGHARRMFDEGLLPLQFDAEGELDKVQAAALLAARRSYAPYSGSAAGLALLSVAGEVVVGSYLESAAFNPSLPAVSAALNGWYLRGMSITEIQRAVLVCTPAQGHEAQTRTLLHTLYPELSLEVILVQQ